MKKYSIPKKNQPLNLIAQGFTSRVHRRLKWEISKICSRQRMQQFLNNPTPQWTFEHLGKTITMNAFSHNDFIGRCFVIHNDFFEPDLIKIMGQFIKQGDTVLDIGANIGNHSVYFSKICGATVHAFEGYAPIFPILEKNIANTSTTLHKTLLGKEKGQASVTNFNSSNAGCTTFSPNNDGDFPICSLDSMKNKIGKVHFMKIDVEGAELPVLQGAVETIQKYKPTIAIEIWEQQYETVYAFLDKLGYKPIRKYADQDYIFVPKN